LISISSSLFYGCNGIRHINIPPSVKNIEKNAFFACNRDLKVVMYSNTVVEKDAFHGITPVVLTTSDSGVEFDNISINGGSHIGDRIPSNSDRDIDSACVSSSHSNIEEVLSSNDVDRNKDIDSGLNNDRDIGSKDDDVIMDSFSSNNDINNNIIISSNISNDNNKDKITKDCINKYTTGCCSGRIEISNLMNSIDTSAFAGNYHFFILF
jgi:hypothetical protein